MERGLFVRTFSITRSPKAVQNISRISLQICSFDCTTRQGLRNTENPAESVERLPPGMDDFRDLMGNISREILVDSQRLEGAAKIKSPSGSALLPLDLSQPNRREYHDRDFSASILDTRLLTELACGTDFGDPVPTRFIISVCRASINLASSASKGMANP